MDVKIIEIATNKVVRIINKEPLTMAQAEKVQAGAMRNLNHDEYIVDIFQS